jgi:hypothetical protein
MRLLDILPVYPEEALDHLAADKLDEIAHLRLPKEVLIQEVAAALSSLSYVGPALAPTRPPAFAFLKLLMDSPGRSAPAHGFTDRVLGATQRLTEQAASGKVLPQNKDYRLYIRMLYAAWEDDGEIDRSESHLLAALRKELGIGIREHLLLQHHPSVRPLWDAPRAYEETRRHLLATGLVLVSGEDFVLADEVNQQIRLCWEIDLEDASYARLLNRLNGEQLKKILDASALQVSGSKDERIGRLVGSLVAPAEVLDHLPIDEVKDLCRDCGLQVSGHKADLIASVLDYFDQERDIAPPAPAAAPAPPPAEPRALLAEQMFRLFAELKLDQLFDILTRRGLRRSGSKPERVARLVDSPWSERTLLDDLRRAELVELCRRLEVAVSGVKSEIIDRLLEWAAREPTRAEPDAARPEPTSDPAGTPPEPASGPPADTIFAETPPAAPAEPPLLETRPERSPVAEPEGLETVREIWPELRPDEQIVLAVLRSARSLNEKEIEKAASRYDLGWFLTKAHMADMLARLRMTGLCPVQVRGSGRHNIYEWIGAGGPRNQKDLDRRAARDVIDALRQGVVPERHLDLLAVGQEAARKHLVGLLDHVRQGRSEFKFIRGPYGGGKSFLCSWLREQALEAGMAASIVRIGPDQPLSELPIFFAGLVDGLRTAEKRDASALADILESWLLALHRQTASLEKLDPLAAGDRARLAPFVEERIGEDLARISGIDPGFGPAVRAFYRARVAGDAETAANALTWLRGGQSLGGESLRALGVRGHLLNEEVFPRMRALLQVISEGHLRGLLLLLDELELVRKFPHARQRERAYETLRLLIDESGENRLPGCLLVATGTDPLFEDDRYGLPSYPALAHRVTVPRGRAGVASVRQPILPLEPLDARRLLEVAERVRSIHGIAYDWPAADRIPTALLERMVDNATIFGEERIGRPPRPFLREFVHLLDLCEERPEIAAEEILPALGPAEEAVPATSPFLDRWED